MCFQYRCGYCNKRRTFKLKTDLYSRRFKFLLCGCEKSRKNWNDRTKSPKWYIDNYRINKEHKISRCNCNEYSFPHRKKSGLCIYNPDRHLLLQDKEHARDEKIERFFKDKTTKILDSIGELISQNEADKFFGYT